MKPVVFAFLFLLAVPVVAQTQTVITCSGPVTWRQGEERTSALFSGDVRLKRGDISLSADRLVAVFPSGSGNVESVVADGNVVISRGDTKMWCSRVSYRPRGEGGGLVLEGDPARTVRSGVEIESGRIEFDERTRGLRAPEGSVFRFRGGAAADGGNRWFSDSEIICRGESSWDGRSNTALLTGGVSYSSPEIRVECGELEAVLDFENGGTDGPSAFVRRVSARRDVSFALSGRSGTCGEVIYEAGPPRSVEMGSFDGAGIPRITDGAKTFTVPRARLYPDEGRLVPVEGEFKIILDENGG